MSVEHVVGDLFAQRDLDALGHGVNCVAKMGSGIAPLFKRRFPDMHTEYVAHCRDGRLTLGGIFAWPLPNGRWIYNLATQHHTGRDARLDAIESALTHALAHATEHQVASLGLPRIGAGIGGLSWTDVSAVIDQVARDHPVLVRVVSLPGAPQ